MAFCVKCGAQLTEGAKFCPKCGAVVDTGSAPQGQPTVNVYTQQTQPINNGELKSKMAAGLLGIFLGSLGIHNFYLGFSGKGVAQLLMTVLGACFSWLIIPAFLPFIATVWGFIEGICILTGSISKDADGNPLV